jgi:hypothetical protein
MRRSTVQWISSQLILGRLVGLLNFYFSLVLKDCSGQPISEKESEDISLMKINTMSAYTLKILWQSVCMVVKGLYISKHLI